MAHSTKRITRSSTRGTRSSSRLRMKKTQQQDEGLDQGSREVRREEGILKTARQYTSQLLNTSVLRETLKNGRQNNISKKMISTQELVYYHRNQRYQSSLTKQFISIDQLATILSDRENICYQSDFIATKERLIAFLKDPDTLCVVIVNQLIDGVLCDTGMGILYREAVLNPLYVSKTQYWIKDVCRATFLSRTERNKIPTIARVFRLLESEVLEMGGDQCFVSVMKSDNPVLTSVTHNPHKLIAIYNQSGYHSLGYYLDESEIRNEITNLYGSQTASRMSIKKEKRNKKNTRRLSRGQKLYYRDRVRAKINRVKKIIESIIITPEVYQNSYVLRKFLGNRAESKIISSLTRLLSDEALEKIDSDRLKGLDRINLMGAPGAGKSTILQSQIIPVLLSSSSSRSSSRRESSNDSISSCLWFGLDKKKHPVKTITKEEYYNDYLKAVQSLYGIDGVKLVQQGWLIVNADFAMEGRPFCKTAKCSQAACYQCDHKTKKFLCHSCYQKDPKIEGVEKSFQDYPRFNYTPSRGAKSLLTYTKDKQIKVLFDTTTYQPSFEADLTIIVYASLKEIKARMKDRVRKLPEKSVVSSWNKIYQPEEILEIENRMVIQN